MALHFFREKIGEKNMKKRTIKELNEMLSEKGKSIRVVSETYDNKVVICHCLKCNQTYKRDRKGLYAKYAGCPVCKGVLVIKGYNDFLSKAPHLKKYLVNEEDGYTHTYSSTNKIKVKCPDCGTQREMIIWNLFKRGFSCPCDGKLNYGRVLKGVNDIATKEPWIADYLVDKSLAEKYCPHSTKYVDFKCPDCGTVIKRKIMHIHRNGFCCPQCSDGVSFPNKFGRFFIKQTPAENIEFEFKREWTNKRYFDIYFEYKGQRYFIEMDSGIHFKNAYFKTYEQVKENDDYKDELARKHGIKMIRIKCGNSEPEYIIENIKKSVLSEIFDLNKIDWGNCERHAMSSLIIDVCKEYNRNKLLMQEIAKKYDLCYNTVCNYISKGKRLGLCRNDISSQMRARIIKDKRIEIA